MNYLNIHTEILTNEAYIGADPVERATWFNLMVFCAIRENGGVIEGAGKWGDRKWQQLCGVTLEEVATESELYGFENGNLMVFLYPSKQEEVIKKKRMAGSKGGRPKKAKSDDAAKEDENNDPVEPLKNLNENHVVSKNKTTCLENPKRNSNSNSNSKGKERCAPLPPTGGDGSAEQHTGTPGIFQDASGLAKKIEESLNEKKQPPPDGGYVAGGMQKLKTAINALKPEWGKPARWSYAEEQHLFGGAAAQMDELNADDWSLLARYMRQPTRQGESYWRPRNRSKFVETFADVWQSCLSWASKTNQQTNKKQTDDSTLWR